MRQALKIIMAVFFLSISNHFENNHGFFPSWVVVNTTFPIGQVSVRMNVGKWMWDTYGNDDGKVKLKMVSWQIVLSNSNLFSNNTMSSG